EGRADLVLRQPREQCLAGRRGVQRGRAAEPVGGHHVRRLHLVDVHELHAPRDREARRLEARLGERAQRGAGAADERVVPGRGAEGDERVADLVAAGRRVALDEALVLERGEDPPRGAAVQPAAVGELEDGRGPAVGAERIEQLRRPRHRLHALRPVDRRRHDGSYYATACARYERGTRPQWTSPTPPSSSSSATAPARSPTTSRSTSSRARSTTACPPTSTARWRRASSATGSTRSTCPSSGAA